MEIFRDAIACEGRPDVVHADSGPAMRSTVLKDYLGDLGVTQTHNRPRVSDDNPFSESEFRTMKYRPNHPGTFTDLEQARAFMGWYVRWYNLTARRCKWLERDMPTRVEEGDVRRRQVPALRIDASLNAMDDSPRSRRGSRRGRATQADIAAEVGVSQGLVSIAYRDAEGVSVETRERILAAGRRLGYVPDVNAARLASQTPRTVGLFLRDLRLTVTADIHEGVSEVAEARGMDLIISVGHADGAQDERELLNLVRAGADVVIAAGTLLPDDDLRALFAPHQLICVTRRVPGVDSVATDDGVGARLIIDHLVALGHRRIAHLAWPLGRDIDTRARGYVDAMNAHQLVPVLVDAGYTTTAAEVAAGELLDLPDHQRPTAIFAANDLAAFGTLDALLSRGRLAPADLSVVGYDDTPPASLRMVSLTTVDQDARTLGRRAAEIAVTRLRQQEGDPVDELFNPRLIVRASTGPAPA